MLHYLLRSRSLPRRILKSQIQSKMTTVLPADLTKPDPLTSSKNEDTVTTLNQQTLRLVDVAINLGDPVFRGVYHGKQVHDDDLEDVLKRAVDVGCVKMLVTGSDLENSRRAVKMAEERRKFFFTLVFCLFGGISIRLFFCLGLGYDLGFY